MFPAINLNGLLLDEKKKKMKKKNIPHSGSWQSGLELLLVSGPVVVDRSKTYGGMLNHTKPFSSLGSTALGLRFL